ncbi:AAA family ATPase [Vibrio sagamiensis]|uniref:Chromosome partitioning ATPase n=1 Tax=Vibrio sagamiensis NBRC 104589 TaxID=1219064 RepID=A0A511QDN0_9VIBR|nr:AAA family ATPase [Vibrio sagamiensis]PNQ54391.1 chromosome partitioning protein ParA [Vibrio agarivorans]GEM75414.1 chromosome partitioning ATPase [Vibrio sagamiensis NBRC 104589]
MSIPATHAEIEQIYLQNEINGFRSICIVGCQSGEGVTSVASALAERWILAGHKTLFVDLNLFKPAFIALNSSINEDEAQLITQKNDHQTLMGLPAPTQTTKQLAYRDPTMLSKTMTSWLEDFDRVIIDTSPLLRLNKNNISAQIIAGICDSTILVASYGSTTTKQLTQAKSLLASCNANLTGAILNMKHTESLQNELLLSVKETRIFPKRVKQFLYDYIKNSDLFTI